MGRKSGMGTWDKEIELGLKNRALDLEAAKIGALQRDANARFLSGAGDFYAKTGILPRNPIIGSEQNVRPGKVPDLGARERVDGESGLVSAQPTQPLMGAPSLLSQNTLDPNALTPSPLDTVRSEVVNPVPSSAAPTPDAGFPTASPIASPTPSPTPSPSRRQEGMVAPSVSDIGSSYASAKARLGLGLTPPGGDLLGLGFAKGTARVPGKGDGTKDTVPAKLAPGEAVLNKPAADMAGRGLIAVLNKMGAQKMGMA